MNFASLSSSGIYSKTSFYSLIGLGSILLCSSVYYMYRHYIDSNYTNTNTNDENTSYKIKSKSKININLNTTNHNSNNTSNNPNTIINPLEITTLITKEVEEILEEKESKFNRKMRLEVFNNKEVYKSVVINYFNERNITFNSIKEKYVKQYSIEPSEFKKILDNVDFKQCEKNLYEIYKPKFENLDNLPSISKTKEAYIFHYKYVVDNIEEIKKVFYSNSQERNVDLLVQRLKADDYLYMNYGYSLNQIKYLISYYKLQEDPEIKYYVDTLGL